MTSLSLDSMMALAQSASAQRRAEQAQQQQKAQQSQQAPQSQQSGGAQGSGGCASQQSGQSQPAADVGAASARNDAAGQDWQDFRAAPAATSSAAPALPAAPAATTAQPAAATTPSAAQTPAPSSSLAQRLEANPSIRTNQNLINHYYQQGGGTWEGASRLARQDGASLNQLIRNRSGLVDRNGAAPSTTTPATTTPATTTPTTPAPTTPVTTTPVTTTPGTTPPPSSTTNCVQQYTPGSPQQVALFTEAGRRIGMSESEAARWANSPGLQNILRRESNGQVGRPNYTYGERSRDPSQWASVQRELQSGRITARSSATGLGQLLLSNVERYYPSGRQGIGNPVEEAAGMMRYIQDRYRTPENAWAQYGRRHEGY